MEPCLRPNSAAPIVVHVVSRSRRTTGFGEGVIIPIILNGIHVGCERNRERTNLRPVVVQPVGQVIGVATAMAVAKDGYLRHAFVVNGVVHLVVRRARTIRCHVIFVVQVHIISLVVKPISDLPNARRRIGWRILAKCFTAYCNHHTVERVKLQGILRACTGLGLESQCRCPLLFPHPFNPDRLLD